MEILILLAIFGFPTLGAMWRSDRKSRQGLMYGPYGYKRAKKGKLAVGTATEQNDARAKMWKDKYHEAIRQRDEIGVAHQNLIKQIREASQFAAAIQMDPRIMACTHRHCVELRQILRRVLLKVRGYDDFRSAA